MTYPSQIGERVRQPIEQAIARGETPAYIAARQNVDEAIVAMVAREMDRLNKVKDVTVPRVPKKHGRPPLKPCGTVAAYHRHIRAKEEPCRPCRNARNQYNADRRAEAS